MPTEDARPPRNLTNPSREGRRFVKSILEHYVQGLISDDDYGRLERELLDIIRAERDLVRRAMSRKRKLEAR